MYENEINYPSLCFLVWFLFYGVGFGDYEGTGDGDSGSLCCNERGFEKRTEGGCEGASVYWWEI
jgi:hypothetical protein